MTLSPQSCTGRSAGVQLGARTSIPASPLGEARLQPQYSQLAPSSKSSQGGPGGHGAAGRI